MDKFVHDETFNYKTMTIIDLKKNLRKEMLMKRAKLNKISKRKYDEWICNSLLKKIEDAKYKTIHCYLPMGTEINITSLIERLLEMNLTLVAPKTLPKRKLENLVLTSLDEVEKGVFGTTHPRGEAIFDGEFDLIIVPGLAFDSANYRLGYGGGYYDNFMVHHPHAHKIGIFYPFQHVEKIPSELHDIILDEILVDKNFPKL